MIRLRATAARRQQHCGFYNSTALDTAAKKRLHGHCIGLLEL